MKLGMPVLWFVVLVAFVGVGVYLAQSPLAPKTPGGTVPAPVVFYCGDGNTISATFATRSVILALSSGQTYTLLQTMSGSGIRYEATSTGSHTFLFVSKGDSASFTNTASTTDLRYETCTAASVTSASSGYGRYEDRSHTFSFVFPDLFSVAGVPMGYGFSWAENATTTGMELARIDVPRSYEPGTNFVGAWFTVGVSSDPSAVATCLENTSGMPSAATTQVTINGTAFTKMQVGGAAAGNRYDTTSYRTLRGGECYAVEYTIHYGVFENYPAGSVQRFDEQKVQSALEGVVQSFKFTS